MVQKKIFEKCVPWIYGYCVDQMVTNVLTHRLTQGRS